MLAGRGCEKTKSEPKATLENYLTDDCSGNGLKNCLLCYGNRCFQTKRTGSWRLLCLPFSRAECTPLNLPTNFAEEFQQQRWKLQSGSQTLQWVISWNWAVFHILCWSCNGSFKAKGSKLPHILQAEKAHGVHTDAATAPQALPQNWFPWLSATGRTGPSALHVNKQPGWARGLQAQGQSSG